MDKIIEILNDIHPGVDYRACDRLIDDHILDSLAILSLVAALEDAYDVSIPAVEINPKNFNSVTSMIEMIERLWEDE